MSKRFLPSKQFTKKESRHLIQERNPNEPRKNLFEHSWILITIRICSWLICGFYTVWWILKMERGTHNVYSKLIPCQVFSLTLGDMAMFTYWAKERLGKLAIEELSSLFKFVIISIVVRALCILVTFSIGASWGQLFFIYAAAGITGLVIDILFVKRSYEYYRKYFKKQLQKLTEELEGFVGGKDDVITELAKQAQSGYFTEFDFPRRQVTDPIDSSGLVSGGLVLLKGECVYYCDAQEYVNRVKQMGDLQMEEITVLTEQRVLKREDINEADIRRSLKKYETKACKITVDGINLAMELAEFEPAEGYFSCICHYNKYVKLEDCRAICRQVVAMEERLDKVRGENRVLRDAIRLQRKKVLAEVEPNHLNDVD